MWRAGGPAGCVDMDPWTLVSGQSNSHRMTGESLDRTVHPRTMVACSLLVAVAGSDSHTRWDQRAGGYDGVARKDKVLMASGTLSAWSASGSEMRWSRQSSGGRCRSLQTEVEDEDVGRLRSDSN